MRISSIYLVKKILHTNNSLHTLSINGYPNSTLSLLKKRKKRQRQALSNTCFLKIPFFNDRISSAIHRAIHHEKLGIQLIHTGTTLRQHLTRKHPPHTLDASSLSNCPIKDTGICLCTHVFYHLQCAKCNKSYIGSTTRPLHQHIKEHINTRISSFHKHIISCNSTKRNIRVYILASVRNVGNLRIAEALLISKHKPSLNNRLELSSLFIL